MQVDIGEVAPAVAAGAAAVATAALLWRARSARSGRWLTLCVALPAAGVICALLAAADLRLSGTGGAASHVVILLDESASARESAWRDPQFVRRLAAARLGDAAQVTVVGFDATARALISDVGVTDADAARWPTLWQNFGTVADSCLAAATQWRADATDERPRWVITDGLLDLSGAAPVPGATILPPPKTDVAISDLRVTGGEVRTRVVTSAKVSGLRVTLLRDGAAIGGTELSLGAGAGRWIGVPVQPGSASYEARVTLPAAADPWPEDNVARLWHTDPGPPRVLSLHKGSVIPRDPWALAAAGWQVIELHNVAETDLSAEQWQTIDAFVRDTGGGVVFSGPQGFASVGLVHNGIAQALLPVSPVQTDGPAARVAFIVDASASMNGDAPGGERREDVALQGVRAAMALLQARDRVAVITFNDAAHLVAAASQAEVLRTGIPPVDAVGGTHPDTSLGLLHEALGAADGPAVVVLLTDGEVPNVAAAEWERTLSELRAKLAVVAPAPGRAGPLGKLVTETNGVWLDGTPAQWGSALAAAIETSGVVRTGKSHARGVAENGTTVGPFAETWARTDGRVLHRVSDTDGKMWPLEAQAQRGLGRARAYMGEPSAAGASRLLEEAAGEAGDRRFALRAQRIDSGWQVVAEGAAENAFVNGANLVVHSAAGMERLRQVAAGRYVAAIPDPRGAIVTEGTGADQRLVGRIEAAEIGEGHPAEWPALAVEMSQLPGAAAVSADADDGSRWTLAVAPWRWELWPWLAGATALLGLTALIGRRRLGIGVGKVRP